MDTSITSSGSEKTLYRKHRPQTLADVSGQQHILAVLRNALSAGKIAHAYLFAGPRGTGKTTIARIMAKRLNCLLGKESEPCGTCAQCVAFQNHATLDLIEIDAASNRGIDEIRALKDRIGLAPAAGKYKIYIVDEVHMLTKEAFNALLKTLEEPPSHVIFILATTELHKVPETIKSRCQTFLFRRASVALITARLKKITAIENADIEDNALNLIANYSEGCFRDAESLLGQVLSTQTKKITLSDVENMLGVIGFNEVQNFIIHVLKKDAGSAIAHLQKTIERGASLRRFADDITRYLRAAAFFAVSGTHGEAFEPAVEEKMAGLTKTYSAEIFVKLLRQFLRAKSEMNNTTYEELPLELVILEWCGESQKPVIQNTQKISQQPPTESSVATKPAVNNPVTKITTDQQNMMAENPLLMEKVSTIWQQFLEKTGNLNPLLISTLGACKPSIVRGNMLYLITEFSLYKDRVMDNNVRGPLENLLAEILGEKILIRVAHKNEASVLRLPEPKPVSTNNIVTKNITPINTNATSDALAVLGGELVGG